MLCTMIRIKLQIMSTKQISTEDVRKLHTEVNQIVNQRYLLSTLAITIFGVIGAWIFPKTKNVEVGLFFGGTLLLYAILFILFLYSFYLKRYLRVITTYLQESDNSVWENDWKVFRNKYKYLGYTRYQSIIFLLLGLMLLISNVLLSYFYTTSYSSTHWIILLLTSFSYVVAIGFLGFKDQKGYEARISTNWKKIFAAKQNNNHCA